MLTLQRQSKHIQKLDVLRGVAIIAVFSYHCLGVTFGIDQLKFHGGWLDFSSAPTKLFYVFYPLTFGWIGVPLFFVISGFCIHLSFLRSSNFSVLGFYRRRFWRIYPPYVVAVITFSMFTHLNITSVDGVLQLTSHLFLVHNLLPLSFFSGINPSFWSLGTEVQFYFMYPLMLALRRRYGMKNVLLFTFGLSLLCYLIGIVIQDWNQAMKPAIWSFPVLLWFDWILGAFLAERYIQGKRAFPSRAILIIPIVMLLFFSTIWENGYTFKFSLAALVSAMLVEIYLNSSGEISTVEKLLVPIGLCSYSFYLWHQPLLPKFLHLASIIGVRGKHSWDMTFGLIFSLLLTFALSWLLYTFIEKPAAKPGKIIGSVLNLLIRL